MNKHTPTPPFADAFLSVCKERAPQLFWPNGELHQGRAAEFFGIPQPTIYRWLRSSAAPKNDKVALIAQKLKVTPAQVRGETNYQSTPREPLSVREPSHEYKSQLKRREAIDNFHPNDADEWKEITANVSASAFALRVEGRSMHNPTGTPSIPHGSIIIVDPEIAATNGRIVVAKLPESNETVVKKLVIDGNQTYLEPLNPDYKPIAVNSECIIIGVVKQVIQDI